MSNPDDPLDISLKRQDSLGGDPLIRAILPVGRSGWAIAAGYLGLFAVLCVPAPLALIAGILAVRDIRRNEGTHGMGRAIFGIVMGVLFSIPLVFMLVALIAEAIRKAG